MNHIRLSEIVDFEDIIIKCYIVDVSVDTDGKINLLTQMKNKENENTRYDFDNVKDEYNLYEIIENEIEHLFTIKTTTNLHYVRKVDDNQYLLASARCHYYSEKNIERNAIILDSKGNVINQIILGDGIQDIKIEDNEIIWTSYFDEGIFGNYGWVEPLGMTGLRSWTLNGEALYVYDAIDYNHSISDCYALNIDENNRKWFYFYTEFFLGQIDNEAMSFFNLDVDGASSIIIKNGYIVMDCGYKKTNDYKLMKKKLGAMKFETIECFNFIDSKTEEFIQTSRRQFANEHMVIIEGTKIYLTNLSEILTELKIT